ncbi:MAG: 3-phosphoshikimate 1-carboxyvinyltransferase, partial [Actinomyces sp.]|nr:3-phosphoshikimate 1-carboxyvinyltransferase [Actinomyces sp.]
MSGTPGDTQWWPAPTSRGPLGAVVEVPGSKSETNRALFLAAIAASRSRIRGALDSRDTRLMTEALEALGARFSREEATGDLLVTPLAEPRAGATLNCGLAGTVLRFLPPLAARAQGTTTFIGDEAARHRPVGPLLEALETWGARTTSLGEPGFLPFQVSGASV